MESWVSLGGKESRTNQFKSWQGRDRTGDFVVGKQKSYQVRQPRPPDKQIGNFNSPWPENYSIRLPADAVLIYQPGKDGKLESWPSFGRKEDHTKS